MSDDVEKQHQSESQEKREPPTSMPEDDAFAATAATAATAAAASEAPKKSMDISFSIWPVSQRTRSAVVKRLIVTLTGTADISNRLADRYGSVPQEEASELAKRIEEDSFNAAGATASPDEEDIDILQAYSKGVSKRLLETFKSRSASAVPETEEVAASTAPDVTE